MPNKKSFWSTLPGILTSVAAVVTAITGLIVIFYPNPEEAPTIITINPERSRDPEPKALKTKDFKLTIKRLFAYDTRCYNKDEVLVAKLRGRYEVVPIVGGEIKTGGSMQLGHELNFDASVKIVVKIEPCSEDDDIIIYRELLITAEEYGKGEKLTVMSGTTTSANYALSYEVR